MSNLHAFDLVVIAGYFLILLGIGYWAARREKNVSADYFLASRDVGWFAVGASLFASNIGSEHLVGLAGTGAASGLAVGHFEWLACLILLLLGWLFVPFYLRSGVYTMPEFLERRFNPASRTYFTWVSIIGYVLTKISVTLYAGGIVMREVTGYSAAAIIPGSTKMNTGRIFRNPANTVPVRASLTLRAASTRCTMCWSVHQYHTPRIGAPNTMPVQGKAG